jgi:uncharacterized repeat protein (TIGR03803 family)
MKSRLLFLFLLLPLLAGAQTYTYSTIVYFGPASEGGPFFPITQPLMDAQGNFYGNSEAGGTFDLGTVFKVTPGGVVTVLHSFNGADGQLPESNLARDSQNNLYGVTVLGGKYGRGTVYKVAPDGTETVLFSFPGTFPDGGAPRTPLILDAAGNIYGITIFADNNFDYNGGSIFKLAPDGTFTLLYQFCNPAGTCANGEDPTSLIMDKAGNLWGATAAGGANTSGNVFMLTPQGHLRVIYSFPCCIDGQPVGYLARSGNNFYVATRSSIYKVTAAGVGSVLYTFPANTHPDGLLTIDSAGNLYGTTDSDTVFKIAPDGVGTTIFTGTTSEPVGGSVILDKAGNLYGTAQSAGQYFAGSIFKLTPN